MNRLSTTAWLVLLLVIVLIAGGSAVWSSAHKTSASPTPTSTTTPEDSMTPSIAPTDNEGEKTEVSPLPSPSSSPAIPASSSSAKQYIDQASALAKQNKYRDAVAVLTEGIQKFPDDTNLKLTREYYENQAQQAGQ